LGKQTLECGHLPLKFRTDDSHQAFKNWLKQADIDEGKTQEGLTSDERDELRRLRQENKLLKQERDFLKKAAAVNSTGERNSGGQCISRGTVGWGLAGSSV
jgi:transposase